MPVTRRKILGWLAGFGAAVVAPSAWMYRMKTYDGPVSDHFDGLHFFDPDGSPPKPLREVLRWQFGGGRHRATWPDRAPSGFADTPPPRVDGNKVRLSFVGPKRHNDPGIAFDALPGIDVVLVSHGHYDHLDLATLSKLQAKCAPRIVTPLGNDIT